MKRAIVSFFALIVISCLSFGSEEADSTSSVINRVVIVKGDHYYPPYEFINEAGEPDGFNIELFAAIARELRLNYKLELGQWSKVWDEVKTGKADVLMGAMVSPQRAEVVNFGIPHSVMTHGIFTRIEENYSTLEELRGKEIIVQEQDRMHEFLIEKHLTDKIILVQSQSEALELLSSGKHDAALLGNFQGTHLIRELGIKNLVVTSSEIEPQKYAMVVNKNNDELLWLLNMGLYQLKENGEYDRLYHKWFGVYEEKDFFWEYRGYIIIVFFALIVMLGFMLLLRNRVRKATFDLRESHYATLQLVDDLKSAKERAEESDRLKSSFLANMSHEIRTPLNSIMGFASLLPEEDSKESVTEYANVIVKNSEQLVSLIDDIVMYSKLQSRLLKYNPSTFEVSKLLTDVQNSFKLPIYQSEIILKFEYNIGETTHIFTDYNKLWQVLVNLISNAFKYTKNGEIIVGCNGKDQRLEFYIKDTGIGILPREIDHIFDRFYRGSNIDEPTTRGTGLGLSIVKELIELLGGKIWVESEVGKGSTFYFTLPCNPVSK